MRERVERQIELRAAPDAVWAALTQPDRLSGWFGARAELDLRAGGRALFLWEDGVARPAVVEELEAPRRFSFRWLPFEKLADGAFRRLPTTRVEFRLEPTTDGTLLTVSEWAPSSEDPQRASPPGPDLLSRSKPLPLGRRLDVSAVT